MDKISPAQLKRWKTNSVGTMFFGYIQENIDSNKDMLEQIAKNPSNYSQEEYYKKCMELGIIIRTWQELLDVKIDFIQGEDKDE